jgi:hypothetical protein
MGIRLYPILCEGKTNADLLKISKESEIKYIELSKEFDVADADRDLYYEKLYQNTDFEVLNSFELNGWGKFKPLEEMRGEDGYIECSGSLEDMDKVKELFFINEIGDVDYSILKGVSWG